MSAHRRAVVCAVAVLSVIPVTGRAEAAEWEAAESSDATHITSRTAPLWLVDGGQRVVRVAAALRSEVADPRIAEVIQLEGGQLILLGRRPGTTRLTVWSQRYGVLTYTLVVRSAL